MDSLLSASNGLLGKCKNKSLSLASFGFLFVCQGLLDAQYRRKHLYSLETFREVIEHHPYHFYQQENADIPVTSQCNTHVFQSSWQNSGRAGRDEIIRAIDSAKSKMKDYLGYRLGLEYVVREVRYPRPNDVRMGYISSSSIDDTLIGVDLGEGYIKEVGAEAFEAINDNAPVVYSDENEDGVNDTATITIAGISSDVNVDNVACYFPASYRTDSSSSPMDKWKVEPRDVFISGTTLTITFNSWVMIQPKKLKGVKKTIFDPQKVDAEGGFATSLQVKRRYTKTDGETVDDCQAVFIWEANPPSWADCSSSNPLLSSDPSAVGVAVARCGIRDARLGMVIPGMSIYNSEISQWVGVNWSGCRQPDRVKVRYRAGADLKEATETNAFSGDWKITITNLAIAELAKHICSCENANSYIDEMSEDLARISGNADKLFRVSERDLDNPFGTRRGHVHAWNRVKNLALTRAFVI